jgi:hypothetical protein
MTSSLATSMILAWNKAVRCMPGDTDRHSKATNKGNPTRDMAEKEGQSSNLFQTTPTDSFLTGWLFKIPKFALKTDLWSGAKPKTPVGKRRRKKKGRGRPPTCPLDQNKNTMLENGNVETISSRRTKSAR